jgi:3-isopropylmalate/(R)-2-methylmalate dehydratase small subunit
VSSRIERISGRAIVLPGDDMDTDRIMPARFLKAITFEGLETHVFEDDRRALAAQNSRHPFDDPERAGARVLFAGTNFGCGSSREHAPQGLLRWGLRAVLAESFAEIFAGNALMIGLACATADVADLAKLREVATTRPGQEFVVDVTTSSVTAGSLTVPVRFAESARIALTTGAWDTTGLLLEDAAAVDRTAGQLPYIHGF